MERGRKNCKHTVNKISTFRFRVAKGGKREEKLKRKYVKISTMRNQQSRKQKEEGKFQSLNVNNIYVFRDPDNEKHRI